MSVIDAEEFFGPARRAHRPRTPSSGGCPMSGSATSGSASRSPRCPAASGSGSSSLRTWPRRATSTSSTSRRPASTSPTSRSCSACSIVSSTPQVGDRHLASSGGHGARRLDHRCRARRRSRRRPDRLRGHTGRPRRRPIHPHRRTPCGLHRRVTDDANSGESRTGVRSPHAGLRPVPVGRSTCLTCSRWAQVGARKPPRLHDVVCEDHREGQCHQRSAGVAVDHGVLAEARHALMDGCRRGPEPARGVGRQVAGRQRLHLAGRRRRSLHL